MEFESIGYVFILPILCAFGIVGNIFTLIVLFKEKFQGVAYSYLKAIATLDLLSLIFVLLTVTRCSKCALRDSTFGPFFEAHMYVFIGDVFVKSSFWTVLIFTAERCITSCFPTSAISLLIQRKVWGGREGGFTNNSTNQRHSVSLSVIVVVVLIALENMPRFWNYRIKDHQVARREIVENHIFFRFYTWFDAVSMCLIPSLALFILNATIIRHLTKRNARPTAPSTFTVAGPEPPMELRPQHDTLRRSVALVSRRFRREQTRILVTLVGIIILNLATILPTFPLNLIGQSAKFSSRTFLNLRVTISILIAVNCSGNFVLYCMLNPRFWSLFKTTFKLDRCSCTVCYWCPGQPATRIIVTRVTPAHIPPCQLQLVPRSCALAQTAPETPQNLESPVATSVVNTGTTTLRTTTFTYNMSGHGGNDLNPRTMSFKRNPTERSKVENEQCSITSTSNANRRFYLVALRVMNDLQTAHISAPPSTSREDATRPYCREVNEVKDQGDSED